MKGGQDDIGVDVSYSTPLGTHHETKRTGVDVGVIHTAVHFVSIVPVCRALVFVTKPPRL